MFRKFFVFLIVLYQKNYPDRWKRHCHFYPSCSEYTKIAIEKYGIINGLAKGINRIKRCKPPVLKWEEWP